VPTTTPRLGLQKPVTADDFDTAEIAANWQKVEDFPGRNIVAAFANLPVGWGAAHEGMSVITKDDDNDWYWDGAAFVRNVPRGLLAAPTLRTSDFSTNQATFQTVVSRAVTYPRGGRSLQIITSWPKAEGDDGRVQMGIFRDAVSIKDWQVNGDVGATNYEFGEGGCMVLIDTPPSNGAYTYTLQIRVPAGLTGSVFLRATATNPIEIAVVEV
jgi:hypothetical protein